MAALVGDPARANMLAALMDGRARTASELAYIAQIAPQTASGHLGQLREAELIVLDRQGRHHYYRLASILVGQMIEGIMAVAEAGPARTVPHWRGGAALRDARTCYDHLAGRLAVGIADGLVARGAVSLGDDGGEVTESGLALFAELGIDLSVPGRSRRAFCKPCLDWSERRPHIAGAVGAALATRAFELGWIVRLRETRAVAVTPCGQLAMRRAFGIG